MESFLGKFQIFYLVLGLISARDIHRWLEMDQPVLVWGVFEETLFCLRRGVCSSYRLHCKIFMVCSSWWLSAAAASCNKQHLLFLLLNLPSWAGHLTDPIFCPNVALKLGKGAERGLLPGRPTEDWVAAEPIPAPALLASQNHPDIPKLETRKRRNRNHGDAVWNIKFVSWFVNPFGFFSKAFVSALVSDDKWS